MRTLSSIHYPDLAEEIQKVSHNYQAKLQENTSRIRLHKEVTIDWGKKKSPSKAPRKFPLFLFSLSLDGR